jgi:transposase
LDKEQKRLRQRIEALALASDLPEGAGRYSRLALRSEMRSWERLNNPGQVSSYTGLGPGVHNSNGRGHEGRINRLLGKDDPHEKQ